MISEAELREKLRKIEALFAGAGTEGERVAAGAAAKRIKKKLRQAEQTEALVEIRFAMRDMWSRRLFTALCRRYGLKPYRYKRQRYTTVMLKAPSSFVEEILWPEFEELNEILGRYLNQITDRIIAEEVYGKPGEAEVRTG